MNKRIVLIGLIVFIVSCAILVDATRAAPNITAYNNSVSGTNLYPHQQVNTNIVFNISSNETITTWTWLKDGVDASNNNPTYTTQWATAGYKNVTSYGTNANGTTEQIIWYPLIEQEMAGAGDTITEINTSAWDSILGFFNNDDPDFTDFFAAIAVPHTSIIGSLFYVIIYGVPFLYMWFAQETAKIPAVAACMLSPILLGAFNPDYIGISVLFILITFLGLIYTLYKERGT